MNKRTLLLFSIILVAAVSRLFPHPDNFAPITALAIFGGYQFKNDLKGVIFPLIALLFSDILMQLTTGYGIYEGMWVVYLTIACIAFLSSKFLNRSTLLSLTLISLASSLIFFLVTNFAVWTSSGLYSRDWAGLVQCFTLAIPFFKSSIIGDLFYTVSIFAIFGIVTRNFPQFAKA